MDLHPITVREIASRGGPAFDCTQEYIYAEWRSNSPLDQDAANPLRRKPCCRAFRE
jgi:hypothetical protein